MIEPLSPDALAARLPEQAAGWVAGARADVRDRPAAIDALFAVAARRCGRAPLDADEGWTADEAARVLLLDALPLRGAALAGPLTRLYRCGDTAERCAVLRALTLLDRRDDLGVTGIPLVEDAIRTNDTRLISAALGGYAARRLGAGSYRQAVLKCVFTEIPLGAVTGLAGRADAELGRMLSDYARERLVAGRGVPADLWPVIVACAGPQATPHPPAKPHPPAPTQGGCPDAHLRPAHPHDVPDHG